MPKSRPALQKPLALEDLLKKPPIPGTGLPIGRPHHSFYVSSLSNVPPRITASEIPLSSQGDKHVFKIDVESIEGHLLVGAPPMQQKLLRRNDLAKFRGNHSTAPYRPEPVPMTHVPTVKKRKRTATRPRLLLKDKPARPLEIFPPDLRQHLVDLSYPWRTTGRTVSPMGDGTVKIGSGTLVGPRHMLTASHVIGWNNPGGPSVSFTPMYDNGAQPFGQASGIWGYWYREENAPEDQLDVSEDYVVVVLDQRLGDTLGWMGTRTYSTDWDDSPYWFNIGYPNDLGGGQIPFWQNQVSFEDADNPGILGQEGDGLYMDTESASLSQGNSGGPFFAFWDTDGWYIVSVASAEGTLDWTFDDDNWAAGGSPMVQLVLQAQADFP